MNADSSDSRLSEIESLASIMKPREGNPPIIKSSTGTRKQDSNQVLHSRSNPPRWTAEAQLAVSGQFGPQSIPVTNAEIARRDNRPRKETKSKNELELMRMELKAVTRQRDEAIYQLDELRRTSENDQRKVEILEARLATYEDTLSKQAENSRLHSLSAAATAAEFEAEIRELRRERDSLLARCSRLEGQSVNRSQPLNPESTSANQEASGSRRSETEAEAGAQSAESIELKELRERCAKQEVELHNFELALERKSASEQLLNSTVEELINRLRSQASEADSRLAEQKRRYERLYKKLCEQHQSGLTPEKSK